VNELVAAAVVVLALLFLPMRAEIRAVILMLGVVVFLAVFQKSNDRQTFQFTQSTAIILVLAIAGLSKKLGRRALLSFLPFFIALFVGFVFIWPHDPGIGETH
jgi:energy-coupling factor transporter transmembrane protein EcfT